MCLAILSRRSRFDFSLYDDEELYLSDNDEHQDADQDDQEDEDDLTNRRSIVILWCIRKFRDENGYTPDIWSLELYEFVRNEGIFAEFSPSELAESVQEIKDLYVSMANLIQGNGEFHFVNRTQALIFTLCHDLWRNLQVPDVEESYRFDGCSENYCYDSMEVESEMGGLNQYLPGTGENSSCAAFEGMTNTVLEILNGLYSFSRAGGGVVPPPADLKLYCYLRREVFPRLEVDLPRPYVADVIMNLEEKFHAATEAPEDPLESIVYEMSKRIWGQPESAQTGDDDVSEIIAREVFKTTIVSHYH
ncbi:OLC1v1003212C1 [Oldenlandia corymbosa var. corymbosa]|uniref:OLC1v1003212C1 n=1 Tax=Oldenlandia corymbosa var. corymbosa TaxID=529605 RepID=A0AAV1DCH4_OLDCO|nr:OLC1v1003212C1 [Oldenlandia corymbosa var. corymbosa]